MARLPFAGTRYKIAGSMLWFVVNIVFDPVKDRLTGERDMILILLFRAFIIRQFHRS